jgi:hypothetical protein
VRKLGVREHVAAPRELEQIPVVDHHLIAG